MIDILDKGRTISGNYYLTLLITAREKIVERKGEKLSKVILPLQTNVAMQIIRDLGI